MKTRPLTAEESANLAALNSCGFASVPLFVTGTGLRKNILDATEPFRRLLLDGGLHDYSQQGQGQEYKRILEVVIHTSLGPQRIEASFYRPLTKSGDPRFWPRRFTEYSAPDDAFAIFICDREIHFINLTREPLSEAIQCGFPEALAKFFASYREASDATANELLVLLREIATSGPLEAVCKGATAIGRSIEAALGIPINSSKMPDFRGIEIKAGRSQIQSRETRATLFACVPDWSLSSCKSSSEIIDKFGYNRGGVTKLYCTVSTRKANSQGLILELEQAVRFLHERSITHSQPDVAVWQISHLESRLAAKHNETFWIQARSFTKNGNEYFDLKSVTHTKMPNIPHFERMLEEGSITMDHLIKNDSGRVKERGPLFKIQRNKIPELFLGEPKKYLLK